MEKQIVTKTNERETTTAKQLNPSKIMQTGMAFWASKILLTAVEFELFTLLADSQLSGQEIQSKLALNDRSLYDFLDSLVALGFLQRSGIKETSVYGNTEDTNLFLDKNKPSYIGGILEMANNRLYPFWQNLEEGLLTGDIQNEVKMGDKPLFETLYSNPEKLNEFIMAMGGAQMGNFMAFSGKFDFTGFSTMCDLGGAGGFLSAQVVKDHDHMRCISFDLPQVASIATNNLKKLGVSENVKIQSGDFFLDEIPKADVITMGNVLHDWGTDNKKALIKKAYEALPKGGALAVIENIIDDERKENAFGLMMSLNMLIETDEGYDFTAADFTGWAMEAGFKETYVMPLAGPSSAAIAVK